LNICVYFLLSSERHTSFSFSFYWFFFLNTMSSLFNYIYQKHLPIFGFNQKLEFILLIISTSLVVNVFHWSPIKLILIYYITFRNSIYYKYTHTFCYILLNSVIFCYILKTHACIQWLKVKIHKFDETFSQQSYFTFISSFVPLFQVFFLQISSFLNSLWDYLFFCFGITIMHIGIKLWRKGLLLKYKSSVSVTLFKNLFEVRHYERKRDESCLKIKFKSFKNN
jgi:hypothetical protein